MARKGDRRRAGSARRQSVVAAIALGVSLLGGWSADDPPAASRRLVPPSNRAAPARPAEDAAPTIIRDGADSLTKSEALPALPRDSDALREAQHALNGEFKAHESSHYIVLTDCDPPSSRAQLARLERTHHQYHRVMRRLDLPAQPLRHKLVCIVFAQRDAYQRFAREHDSINEPWIGGYYAPHADRIVFYDFCTNPDVITAGVQLAEMRSELHDLRKREVDAVRAGNLQWGRNLSTAARTYEDHLRGEEQRIREFEETVSIATTTHEATHQLLFHTGVQSALHEYPFWISEGLASCFETGKPEDAFGPDHEFAMRREQFESALREDRLLGLRTLVQVRGLPPGSRQSLEDMYAQSYALIVWMCRFRRDELRTFLSRMPQEKPGLMSPAGQLRLFEECFGDVDALERAWLRHERSRIR